MLGCGHCVVLAKINRLKWLKVYCEIVRCPPIPRPLVTAFGECLLIAIEHQRTLVNSWRGVAYLLKVWRVDSCWSKAWPNMQPSCPFRTCIIDFNAWRQVWRMDAHGVKPPPIDHVRVSLASQWIDRKKESICWKWRQYQILAPFESNCSLKPSFLIVENSIRSTLYQPRTILLKCHHGWNGTLGVYQKTIYVTRNECTSRLGC